MEKEARQGWLKRGRGRQGYGETAEAAETKAEAVATNEPAIVMSRRHPTAVMSAKKRKLFELRLELNEGRKKNRMVVDEKKRTDAGRITNALKAQGEAAKSPRSNMVKQGISLTAYHLTATMEQANVTRKKKQAHIRTTPVSLARRNSTPTTRRISNVRTSRWIWWRRGAQEPTPDFAPRDSIYHGTNKPSQRRSIDYG